MFRKLAVVFIPFIFVFTMNNVFVQAEITSLQHEDIRTLLIYSNDENKQTENVRKLDLLLHHFTKHVSIMSDATLPENDSNSITHIVYYGEHQKELQNDVKQFVDNFSGPIIAIGENVEQFETFQSLQLKETVQMNEISFLENEEKRNVAGTTMAYQLVPSDTMEAILFGYTDGVPFPVMVEKAGSYYLSALKLDDLTLHYVAEVLHNIFPNDHPEQRKAYIQLENIHPASDPVKVLEVAQALIERNIPFSLAVTPVYTNRETNEQIHLDEAEELLDVLNYLQRVNGTVITHGYTNDEQLGYEFWDATLDQIVTETEAEGDHNRIPVREDFPSHTRYNLALEEIRVEELSYLTHRLEKAIYEQTRADIYPLAFTAPNDAMSEQGYQTVSNFYTVMFGRLQMTDDTFRSTYTPPFMTTGSFLHGMTFYPETVGNVTDFEVNAHPYLTKKLDEARIVRDSVIGITYETYVGADYVDDVLKKVEEIPHISWLNLRETKQLVTADKVRIETENADITVTNELTFFDEWKEIGQQLTAFEKVLWAVTLLVLLFISMFLLFALHLRLQLKKRLFRERK